METTKVSSKGQIVLPKGLREDYGWGVGTDLAIERGPGSVTLRRNDGVRPTTIDEVAGCLKYNGPSVSLEDMERGIEKELPRALASKEPMIGVDTNVLVRFLVQGDRASQTAAARRLFAENLVAVAYTVLLETEWVLRGTFGFARAEIAGALLRLLGMPTVFFDRRDAVLNALRSFENGIDFADALHLATSASNLAEFATFDRDFARPAGRHALAPPVRLLPN